MHTLGAMQARHALLLAAATLFVLLLAACDVSPPADDEAIGENPAALRALGPPGTLQTVVIPRHSSWKYDDSGIDQGTDWRTYQPSTWREAPGPLGYGETYLASTISYGNDPAHKRPTAYFGKQFYGWRGIRAMYLRVMYDDGFVFYINGREGGRASMPAGPVTFSTLAQGHEASNHYVTFDISAQIPNVAEWNLNTLAFEVHQTSPSSSDLVFDAELVIWTDDAFEPISAGGIPKGSYWRFWDRGGDLGSAWQAPGFDATGWSVSNGPLGFGEDYLATELASGPITTYFRTRFDFEGSVNRVLADVMYDDGFVAYLNGHEIGRASMPRGAPRASTIAAGHEANNTYETFDWTEAARPYVVAGENSLAVEVHQGGTHSSDLVFDLGLRVVGGWSEQPNPTSGLPIHGVDFIDASHGFAVGYYGMLLETTDRGAHWLSRDAGTGEVLHAIQFADATHGWISGYNGTILATTDAGATWVAQTMRDVTVVFTGMSFTSITDGWLVGYSPDPFEKIYHTVDGGQIWTPVREPDGYFWDIGFADAQHGWVVGYKNVYDESGSFVDDRGVIYGTSDGGATWTLQWQAPFHFHHLFDVEVIDAQTAWAVGQGATSGVGEILLVTHDGGATWEERSSGVIMGLTAIDFVDSSFGWAVGDGGEIIHTEDGGETWSIQESADRYQKPWLADVSFVDRQNGWAVGSMSGNGPPDGKILHTSSGGK